MINPLHIAEGIANNALGINKSMSELRMEVCRKCPLFSNKFGGLCNSRLWLDPETNDISDVKQPGYISGCGCKLSFKTSVASEECPAGKW